MEKKYYWNFSMFIVLATFLSSCAASYNAIDPARVKYPTVQAYDTSVVVQYKYDVLDAAGNKKYYKKEAKFRTNLVAVKITNNTDSLVNTDQLIFSSGNRQINPMSPEETKKMLKQKGGYHLFYLLLTPMQFYSGTSSAPIGLVIGPGLTLINMGVAASANKNFLDNLQQFSIKNKNIPARGSIYGLVGFSNSKGEPIYVKRRRLTY